MKVTFLRISNTFKDPDIYTGLFKDENSLMQCIVPYMEEFYKDCNKNWGDYFNSLYNDFIKNPSIESLNKILYTNNEHGNNWYEITNIEFDIRRLEVQ